ncbi:hypothetical protein CGZ98_15855 [Enemella evansiae]|uniref:HYR domain-containing protein n=1 Tax=Enemella evansiae TaxID=2016499 RepID=UPI000B96204E|nr:HYR domain-containing protein [Enemella evansiae]OYO08038.1 hypothetical protein CGZ98_15855 [Enemella evansiae]
MQRTLVVSRFVALTAASMLLLAPIRAMADDTTLTGDGVTPVSGGSTIDLGTVCVGESVTKDVLVSVTRQGQGQVFGNGSTVTVTASATGTGLTAALGSNTIKLPANWEKLANRTQSGTVSAALTLSPTTAGAFSGSVAFDATGASTDKGTITRSATLAVTGTARNCNTAPTITVNDVTLEGNTLGGRALVFDEIGSATDAEDQNAPAVSCMPATGSVLPLGANRVSCTATDSAGLTATATGTVTVVDTAAPVLTELPASATIEATSAAGAAYTYQTPKAQDVVWGDVPVSCTPASGGTFPVGSTTITCTATDGAGQVGSGSFVVNVVDTTAPVITVSDVTAEGNTRGGATVEFALPTATDTVDGSTVVTCDKSSGDLFPVGDTTVTCTSTDSAGNRATAAFVVRVTDTTAPVISAKNLTVEGNTTGGATVTFDQPTATDIVDGATTVSCSKSSGDFFDLGENTVTCTSVDRSGNQATATFTVTVTDSTAPVLTGMPQDATVEGNTLGGANWSYVAPTATDVVDANPGVTCEPGDSAFYPLGKTTVTCTATDASGNKTSASFTVTVVDTAAPVIELTGVTPAPNAAGWNNGAVTATWTCTDSVSGASTVTETVSTEGANQSVTGTCTDKSGNSASNTVSGINIDKTAPALTVNGPENGSTISSCTPTAPARPTFTATDAFSGVADQGDNWTTPASGVVGSYTYTAWAIDNAGNRAEQTRRFTVATKPATMSAFSQPINADGSSRFKLGSTIPVKIQVTCDGKPVTDAVVKLTVQKLSDSTSAGEQEAVSTSAATTGNLFRYSDPQYIFNLSTKSGYSTGSYQLTATLADGQTRTVTVQLVK